VIRDKATELLAKLEKMKAKQRRRNEKER